MNIRYIDTPFPKIGTAVCSGIEGSNAQSACMKFFPEGSIVYVDSFRAVFEAVNSGQCEYGVLPIENSFNGSVREVYTLLANYKFFIVRSLLLHIRHHLLAKRGQKITKLERVYSHPQALGQCSVFMNALKDKYGTESIPFWNTAGAAKMIRESEDVNIAAIASPLCAELYGLETLASDIQDNNNNYTQFICISKNPAIYAGADHISFAAECENAPGALSAVLSKIAEHGVNMKKLESCPKKAGQFEYKFCIEIKASVKDEGIKSMLEDIENLCKDFTFLGNYEVL